MSRKIVFAIAALLCLGVSAGAQDNTPEEVTEAALTALSQNDYVAFSHLLDPESAAKFQSIMAPLLTKIQEVLSEQPPPADAELPPDFMANLARADSLPPDSFMLVTFQFFGIAIPEFDDMMASLKGDIVCKCFETDSLCHVVTRGSSEAGGIKVENAMDLVSLRLTDSGWKMILSSDIMGLAEAIKMGMGGP
jgi:hypothetical protein